MKTATKFIRSAVNVPVRADAGACPECGAPKERTEDNGLRRSDPEYSIRCQDCDNRWEPNA